MNKKIQLKKLELTNYRNIEHAVYEFDGNSKIVGDNRIGKTNTLEAIYYLLTGYLLNGSSDIQAIKPQSNTRAIVSVEGSFDVDGTTITICKKFGEEWAKQRNTGEEVMRGHFSELYYNGVKQGTLKDFNALFYNDFGITQSETVKISFTQMLCNPFFIGDLCEGEDWKEVRKFIIELVGDVSDEDVYAKEHLTVQIKDEMTLANGRVDQVKKKIDAEIKGLKESLIADDAKIDMLTKTERPSESDVAVAKKAIEEIDTEIHRLQSPTGNHEAEVSIKGKIADIDMKIADLKTEANKSTTVDELIHLGLERDDLFSRKSAIVGRIQNLNQNIKWSESKIERLKSEKQDLLDEYHDLKDAPIVVDTVCPTCKRPLDSGMIEKAKADLIDTNKTKMDIIVIDGKKKAAEIEAEEKNLNDYKAKVVEEEKALDNIQKDIDTLNVKIEDLKAKQTPQAENPEIAKLREEKAKLQNELIEIQSNEQKARNSVSTQIYELEQKKAPYQKVIDDVKHCDRLAEERVTCEKEKEIHNATLIKKEQLKDLVQKFTFTKLQMLDSNVSKVFGNIKFQLIKENINGGFDSVCKPFIYDPILKQSTSVLWKSGSKSERVATGIAIAEAIKMALGLADMPYLFDEGGEISSDTLKTRLVTESQIICVKVQDNIKSPIVTLL